METSYFLEISVTTYKPTWCDDPEHHNLNNLCSRYSIIEWFTQWPTANLTCLMVTVLLWEIGYI